MLGIYCWVNANQYSVLTQQYLLRNIAIRFECKLFRTGHILILFIPLKGLPVRLCLRAPMDPYA